MKTAGSPPVTPPTRQDIADPQGLARDAARELAAVGTVVLLGASALASLGGLGADHVLKAVMVYAAGAWLVWRALASPARPHPHARFGPANRITLARLGAMALMAALAGEAVPRAPLGDVSLAAWALVVAATLTALLDAVDGALARRSGLVSAFGARFDMETDAAFTLVLCVLVLQSGQAGGWILASGLMRYAFVAAAMVWPWLNGPLPPSRRRQTVCVVQITTLIVCLGPIVPPLLASGLAAISLALLTLSFAIDVRTLARQRPIPPET